MLQRHSGVVSFFDHATRPKVGGSGAGQTSFGGRFGNGQLRAKGDKEEQDGDNEDVQPGEDETVSPQEVPARGHSSKTSVVRTNPHASSKYSTMTRKPLLAKLKVEIEHMQKHFKANHDTLVDKSAVDPGAILLEIDDLKTRIQMHMKRIRQAAVEKIEGYADMEGKQKRYAKRHCRIHIPDLGAFQERIASWPEVPEEDEGEALLMPEPPTPLLTQQEGDTSTSSQPEYDSSAALFYCFRLKAYVMRHESRKYRAWLANHQGQKHQYEAEYEEATLFLTHEHKGEIHLEEIQDIKAMLRQIRAAGRERHNAGSSRGSVSNGGRNRTPLTQEQIAKKRAKNQKRRDARKEKKEAARAANGSAGVPFAAGRGGAPASRGGAAGAGRGGAPASRGGGAAVRGRGRGFPAGIYSAEDLYDF